MKKDFQSLFYEKRILSSKNYVFYLKDFDLMVCKVTVKKKIGNAVVRNLYKRRLRVILRSLHFKRNYLILGVVMRKHELDFESEKNYVVKVLQPLIG